MVDGMKKAFLLVPLTVAVVAAASMRKIEAKTSEFAAFKPKIGVDSLEYAKYAQRLDSLSEAFARQITDYRSQTSTALLPDSAFAPAVEKIRAGILAEFDSLKNIAGLSAQWDSVHRAQLSDALANVIRRALIWGVELPEFEAAQNPKNIAVPDSLKGVAVVGADSAVVATGTGVGGVAVVGADSAVAPVSAVVATGTGVGGVAVVGADSAVAADIAVAAAQDTLLQFSALISSTSTLVESLTYADWMDCVQGGACKWSDAGFLVSKITQTAGWLDASKADELQLKISADSLGQKYYEKLAATKRENAIQTIIGKLDGLVAKMGGEPPNYAEIGKELGKLSEEVALQTADKEEPCLTVKLEAAKAMFEKLKKDAFSKKHE